MLSPRPRAPSARGVRGRFRSSLRIAALAFPVAGTSVRAVSRIALALLLGLLAVACDEGRGATREWTPADHDQPQGPNRQVAAASARAPGSAVDPSLVELSWQQKCASCHGPQGRGDGPQGAMVAAPDLTRDDFLSRAKDEEIATVIRQGRGRMPPFDLPPSVLDGLVKRIRAKGMPR